MSFTPKGPIPLTVGHLRDILMEQEENRPVTFFIPAIGRVPITKVYVNKNYADISLGSIHPDGEDSFYVYEETGAIN